MRLKEHRQHMLHELNPTVRVRDSAPVRLLSQQFSVREETTQDAPVAVLLRAFIKRQRCKWRNIGDPIRPKIGGIQNS